ncbi:MAG: SDR family NAD(P)-dependent oxidoreductase [Chitinophagaceae bacterium]|nr:MAG: SDR family NAD(P)-dependent oxidoreductase [Chitinophagaceae bacterium]
MARIFITGSADGLGAFAARQLIAAGHSVMLHARNEVRAEQATKNTPGAEGVLVADLSSITETKELAVKANASGPFDAVIHNAGIYTNTGTSDGLTDMLTVNTLAPYILTCLLNRPGRLVYLSSGMHLQGDPDMNRIKHASYSTTKLHDLLLAKIVARKWSSVFANAVDPGWVPTKMGGSGAPDNLEKGYETQVWLASSNDAEALVSGKYFHHKRQAAFHNAADDEKVQAGFIARCEELTGVKLES